MAAQAVIGNPFTFQVLFVDVDNNPTAVDNPIITVFSFSLAGAKNVLVANAAMVEVTPVEVGRYVYVYTVPITFSEGDMLYAEIQATSGGFQYRLDEKVILTVTPRVRIIYSGLVAQL